MYVVHLFSVFSFCFLICWYAFHWYPDFLMCSSFYSQSLRSQCERRGGFTLFVHCVRSVFETIVSEIRFPSKEQSDISWKEVMWKEKD
jgi:hypothetical protein